jgi:hypothetical protein
MSVNAVEKILWDICNAPERLAQYRSGPDALIAGYNLTAGEQRMVRGLEVRELTNYNVNPMLIMMTWNALIGADKIGEYLGKLNAPTVAA